MPDCFDKLQQHTITLYDLKNKEYEIKTVPAQSLITVNRFDLFAKLVYIKYRDSQQEKALSIYEAHIKAFNPDGKEPGREDKNGIQDFVTSFNKLIDYFEDNDFDPEISLVPVSENGTILDGSHRVAALAFFKKEVVVAKFKGVKPISEFDDLYFKKRGLPFALADHVALEAPDFAANLFVACLWPRLGSLTERKYAMDYFQEHFQVFYRKEVSMSLDGLSKFVYEIYKQQDWVGDENNHFSGARNKALQCYGNNKIVQFIIFQADSLEEVVRAKDAIREYYRLEKHALHITDNQEETKEILNLILTERVKMFSGSTDRLRDKWVEWKTWFKNVYWIGIKVKVAQILKKIGVYG